MLLDGVISVIVAKNTTAQNRVYKKRLPRGYKLPAIVVHRYGSTQENDLQGPTGVREDQVQMDVYTDDETVSQSLIEILRDTFIKFTGALPEGTVVQLCVLEREQDMPFLPYGDQKSDTGRSLLGFRFITNRV